jgi:hypothetical protein
VPRYYKVDYYEGILKDVGTWRWRQGFMSDNTTDESFHVIKETFDSVAVLKRRGYHSASRV